MIDEVIIGGIGLFTTIISSGVSWILARKKYYSEVDHNLIENMEKSLEFYQKLSDDNRARLDEMARRNSALEVEVQEMRKQILNLTMNICMDLTCARRVREHQIIAKGNNGKNKSRYNETEDSSRGGL